MPSRITIQELDKLYSAAVALPVRERKAFLDSACGGMPETRSQLERMLEAEEGFLAQRLLVQAADPTRVGKWILGDKIGEGGLGFVYKASTVQDGVTVEAAVKLLRPGFDTNLFRDRFQRERQILASLDYPGIARLIDCGSESGRSWLAMEFVAGQPMGSYLASVNPSKRQRVELVTGVARAVRYLHSQLVVHGDVKPANVMVTPGGSTKLLDFGAARLLGTAEPGELTRIMLTPGFASPERKGGAGASVASDIYSLGCLLSEVMGSGGDRDLDAIARHCQETDPAGRYLSAAEFIEDLERWRTGHPVRARRLTVWYAVNRFGRRYWHLAAMVFLLAGALASGWWNARRAERLARQLAEETSRQARLAQTSALESERLRAAAEQASLTANENAERYRTLLRKLIDEQPGEHLAEGGRVLESELLVSIEQLERAGAPLSDIATAYRRLGVIQCRRGEFPAGLESIRKAKVLARRWRSELPCPASRRLALIAELSHAQLLRLRGADETAAKQAYQAVQTFESLPANERIAFNRTHLLQEVRVAAATHVTGTSRERELLRAALDHGRRDIASIGHRGRASVRLIEIARISRDQPALEATCEEAARLVVLTPQVASACNWPLRARNIPPSIGPVATLAIQLGFDPDLHRVRAELAGRYLALAGMLWRGDARPMARNALAIGQQAVDELAANDPEGPVVKDLVRQVNSLRELMR